MCAMTGTTEIKALLVFICCYVTKDSGIRATTSLCLYSEFMCLANPPIVGGAVRVMQVGSPRERHEVSSPEMLRVPFLSPLPFMTGHATSSRFKFIRPVLSSVVCPRKRAPEIKGITNDLCCWSSRDFAQLPYKGRPKSNHIIPAA